MSDPIQRLQDVIRESNAQIAATERRGYDRAVANLRDYDRYRLWLDSAGRDEDEPLIARHIDYLEATKETDR